MSGLLSLAGAAAMALGTLLSTGSATAGDAALVASPDDPGPQYPPVGRSLFDEMFGTAAGSAVPFPFSRLIETLNARIAPEQVRTALIPLGRSLQRYAADPHYFQSPRLVLAVTEDATDSGPPADTPRLKDRLFLGYQPASEVIEVISYNEAAGRFEFQEVTGYGEGGTASVSYAPRDICVACHQGHAPIFSRPLWSESNANPGVADRLSGLGVDYHGAPVRQGIDAVDDFDQSTDRANRIGVANRLWDEGCGATFEGTSCRAVLLAAALRFGLTGGRPDWIPPNGIEAERFMARTAKLWPDGLAGPDPDLPNVDAVAALAAGQPVATILDAGGQRNPETPRMPRAYWMAGDDPLATLAAAAREISGSFSKSDIAWLDRRLAATRGTAASFRSSCRSTRLDRRDARFEIRLTCGASGAPVRLAGFVVIDEATVQGGRIDILSIDDGPPIRRLRIGHGRIEGPHDSPEIWLELRDDSGALDARLLSGERIDHILIAADGTVEVTVVTDLDALDDAIDTLATGDDGSLGPGPLRRRAVLAGLALNLSEP